ncbi:hypothetical protein JCM16408A_26610 [Methylobacterium phyllosphaerae]
MRPGLLARFRALRAHAGAQPLAKAPLISGHERALEPQLAGDVEGDELGAENTRSVQFSKHRPDVSLSSLLRGITLSAHDLEIRALFGHIADQERMLHLSVAWNAAAVRSFASLSRSGRPRLPAGAGWNSA